MVRDDKDDSNSEVVIETLTPEYFDGARAVESGFVQTRKGFCFGLCPYRFCPVSKSEFEQIYRQSADRCSTYGVAVRQTDQLVIGICKLRTASQPSKWKEDLLHDPSSNEMYVDTLAVTAEARGKGVGARLLNWAEEEARERKATRMILGVSTGNPARRLYERVGYVETESACFWPSCLLGRPNGSFGGAMMEKKLT
eukprot:scaffold4805_cov136-Cylindrotheca_fusiformis.AAC.23